MIRAAHTADLDKTTLKAARALLDAAFSDDFFTEDDWEHGLGGVHALAYDHDELVGHGSVVQRRLIHQDRALRAGYVEGVAVAAHARRRGHATALMTELNRIIRSAYDLGALGATDEAVALYTRCGWQRWEGPLFALTPDGVVATPDEQGA
ncbi:MAG TPA: GNAT family N-acetyltransferase, partial [Solirubrobacter sp.]|nr:GNAT family N-acetyltransferase [Solirubrobacter sp.]